MKRLFLSAALAAFGAFAIFVVPGWRASQSMYFGAPPPNATVEFILQLVTACLPVVIANYPALQNLGTVVTDLVSLLRKLNQVDWDQVIQQQKKAP